MTRVASKADLTDPLNKALNARVFKRMGVSANSRWARNYAQMMSKPLTKEEWQAFEEKMKDPAFADRWFERVMSGWHRMNVPHSSRRRSKKSKGS